MKTATTLYYREGNSDKVYQCAIEPSGEGFVVNFAYGRRGNTLNTGTKTSSPVDSETARQIYDKLVREKLAKGYTTGPEGAPYQNAAVQTTGILPQLLNPVEEAEVEILLANDDWCLQEKLDGRRMLLQKQGAAIQGINRKGLAVGLPTPVILDASKMPGDFTLDGECVDDVLHVFDLLSLNGEVIVNEPYHWRLDRLSTLLEAASRSNIEFVETAFDSKEKTSRFQKLKIDQAEGAVFKRLLAPYTPGRPNSGGDQLKCKFTATVSAVVAKINPQRSVELRLIGQLGWVTAGNVTIPANHPVPTVGTVVEVRYLYAFPVSGVLYQPVYLGSRTDIDPAECMMAQLKFKPSAVESRV